MFIYKITVLPINKVYIGMDTGPVYKKKRWKEHCRELKRNSNRKIYEALRKYGIENCIYEVLETGFSTIGELAIAEIKYIQQHDSYRNGLNSSLGGDGLGHNNWAAISEEDLLKIKEALGEHFKNYNKKKWSGTTPEERKKMLKHWFEPDVIQRRTETLKEYYKANPDSVEHKVNKLREWREKNKEHHRKVVRENGAKGAAKVSKKLKVETENGEIIYFSSKSEFNRKTGQWANTVLKKTKQGQFYNGYKAEEI